MTDKTKPEQPTPGPWKVCQSPPNDSWHKGVTVYSESHGSRVADTCPLGDNHAANAELIADAGTVFHETGQTPSQLREQRDFLLHNLKEMVDVFAETKGSYVPECSDTDDIVNDIVVEATKAIDKAEGST